MGDVGKENTKKKRSILKLFAIFFLFLFFACLVCSLVVLYLYNKQVIINKVTFSPVTKDKYVNNIVVEFQERFFDIDQQVWCLLSTEKSVEKITKSDSNWIKASKNKCTISAEPNEYYLYFKNNDGVLSYAESRKVKVLKLSSFDITDKKVILVPSESYKLNFKFEKGDISDTTIKWESTDNKIINVQDGKVTGVGAGSATITGTTADGVSDQIEITVTSLAQAMPKSFSYNKPFLECGQYTSSEAKLLDEYLENRISRVGYKTRAGVVEAARFLTLSFPYRISYFFENGRLNPIGGWLVDGEGRYYHKGLYLSKEKYSSIKPSMDGPVMWGCNLINRDDTTSSFILYAKYPNGLDCSGFVTWVLLNGGFDVGDIGAGDVPYYKDLSDLGEYLPINYHTLSSGKVKVGDLVGIRGHAAIIVGIDNKHFYVAESNTQFKGVVLNTYTWSELMYNFTFIRMMDSVYKEDGKLTNMWY